MLKSKNCNYYFTVLSFPATKVSRISSKCFFPSRLGDLLFSFKGYQRHHSSEASKAKVSKDKSNRFPHIQSDIHFELNMRNPFHLFAILLNAFSPLHRRVVGH